MVLRYVTLVPARCVPDEEKSAVLVRIFLIVSDRKSNKLPGVKRNIYLLVKVKHPG